MKRKPELIPILADIITRLEYIAEDLGPTMQRWMIVQAVEKLKKALVEDRNDPFFELRGN